MFKSIVFVLSVLIYFVFANPPGYYDKVSKGAVGYYPRERCELPIDPGLCRGYFEKYAFDTNQNKCVKFIYGGCQGNGNRFDTQQQCCDACE